MGYGVIDKLLSGIQKDTGTLLYTTIFSIATIFEFVPSNDVSIENDYKHSICNMSRTIRNIDPAHPFFNLSPRLKAL